MYIIIIIILLGSELLYGSPHFPGHSYKYTSSLPAEVNSAQKMIVYYAPCSAVNSERSRLAGWLRQY